MADLGNIAAANFRPLKTSSPPQGTRDWSNLVVRVISSPTVLMRHNTVGASSSVSGTVKENGAAVAGRAVAVFRRDTLAFLGQTISAANGSFSVPLNGYTGQVLILALDAPGGINYNALVADQVVPA